MEKILSVANNLFVLAQDIYDNTVRGYSQHTLNRGGGESESASKSTIVVFINGTKVEALKPLIFEMK